MGRAIRRFRKSRVYGVVLLIVLFVIYLYSNTHLNKEHAHGSYETKGHKKEAGQEGLGTTDHSFFIVIRRDPETSS